MPLNLSKAGDSVDHIVTGSWSKKAAEEARKYCKVNVAAKGDNKHIPEQKSWKLQKQAKYVHYCDNETIQVASALFTRWHQLYCKSTMLHVAYLSAACLRYIVPGRYARNKCRQQMQLLQGVEFKSVPDVGETLLVADMSSNFCSKPVDVSKYGLIYAGAQKNIGPSGVTVYIIRDDLVGHARYDKCSHMPV